MARPKGHSRKRYDRPSGHTLHTTCLFHAALHWSQSQVILPHRTCPHPASWGSFCIPTTSSSLPRISLRATQEPYLLFPSRMTPDATGIGLFLHAQMPDDSQQDIGSTTQEGDNGLTLLRHACSPAPSAELSLISPPLRPGFSPHPRVRDAE